MIIVNFLSPEYRQKIFLRKFARFAMLVVALIVIAVLAGGMVLKGQVDDKISQRDLIIKDIADIKAKTEEIKKATGSIVDLSNKIQILDDILNQKKYGFSEVLYRLQQNIPEGVWLKSLKYDGKTLVLNGLSNGNSAKGLSAERNLLTFERNLRETPSYLEIVPEYSKLTVVNGNELKEFKITITLASE
jgi:Tfp pilus assembly protein PilN